MDGIGKLLLMIVVLVLVISGHGEFIFVGFLGFLGLCFLSSIIDYMFPAKDK